ncbi:MAG: carboxypeptidase regulatory-like domain-containing protein [Rhodopirellula sp.]|nr:carboxypeptidase regulatory-like domain-containing protein [Rhodopirellula sp.]
MGVWVLPLAALLLLPGCSGGGGGDVPDLAAVTGVVTLDGQPLADANVEFAPAAGRPSVGKSGPDGRYTLEYTSDHPGAMIGAHTVRISTGGYSDAGPVPEKLPPRYHENTELKADVKAGSNEINFELSSK